MMQEQEDDKPESDLKLGLGQLDSHRQSQAPLHPSPIRINADDESKCVMMLYCLTIVLPMFLALMLVVFLIPNAVEYLSLPDALAGTDMATCSGYLRFTSGPIKSLDCFGTFAGGVHNSPGVYVRNLQNLNQFLSFHLNLQPYAEAKDLNSGNFNQVVLFTLWDATLSSSNLVEVGQQLYSGPISIDKSIKVLRQKAVLLGVESKLTSEDQFYWTVTFTNGSAISSPGEFHLETETVRASFTIYTILLRSAFFLASLAVFIRYNMLLLRLPKQRISVQQRCVQGLGALTLTFNDQLYFISILWPNAVTSFINAVFLWNLFFGLLALWTVFLLRVYYEEGETESPSAKECQRVVPFTVTYLFGLAFTIAYALLQHQEHPLLTVQDIEKPFFEFLTLVTVMGLLLVVFYILYLFLLVINKEMLAYRHTVFINVSAFFFIAVLTVVFLGSLDIFVYSSALVMFTFTVVNLYSFLLQYLYSPSQPQLGLLADTDLHGRELEQDLEVETVDIDLTILAKEDPSDYGRSHRDSSSRSSKSRSNNQSSSHSGGSYKKEMRQRRRQLRAKEEKEGKHRQGKDQFQTNGRVWQSDQLQQYGGNQHGGKYDEFDLDGSSSK